MKFGRAAVAATVLLGAAWFLFLRPATLGGSTTYVFVSGQSMMPTLRDGDVALVRESDSYGNRDIVTFIVPRGELGGGSRVIHRIVGGDGENGFVMQGDNKEGPDPWTPKQSDIVGKLWFRIPLAGKLLARVRTPIGLAIVAGLVAVWVVLGFGSRVRNA